MKYYSIGEPDDDIMPVHFKNGDLPYPVSKLEEGMKLKHKPQKPTIYIDKNVILQDWASVVLPLVSKKFLNLLLENNIGDLEYFPVDLVDKEGVTHEYYILNYIPVLNHALDKKSSKIIKHKSKLLKDYVAVPSIIEKETKGLDFFRLHETGFRIFITEKFRKIMKQNGITGLASHQVVTVSSQEK